MNHPPYLSHKFVALNSFLKIATFFFALIFIFTYHSFINLSISNSFIFILSDSGRKIDMVKYGKTEKTLTEEHGRHGSSGSSSKSSASSSSDSEYYSPEEMVGKNAKHHRVRRSPKVKNSKVHKLMMSESEVPVGSEMASTSTTENNITAGLDIADYNASTKKIQQLEKVVSDLNHERQELFRTLMDEVKSFFGEDKKFSASGAQEQEVDFISLVKEVKKEAMTVKFQLDSKEKENQEITQYIEECNANMTRLKDENGALRAKIDELENLPRPRCESCDTSKVIYEDTKALQSKLQVMVAQVGDLQLQNEKLEEEAMLSKNDKKTRHMLESRLEEMVAHVSDLQRQNEKLEKEVNASKNDKEVMHMLESKLKEINAQVSDLQRENVKLEEEVRASKSDKEAIESRMEELVKEVKDLENQNKEMKEKIVLYEGTNEEKQVLESRVEDQVAQIGELRSQNGKLEKEIASSKMENETIAKQMVAMQQEMESLNRKKRELIEQINTIQVERLNDEMSRSREDEKRVKESHAMVKNLEMQIDSSNKQKSEIEAILKETGEENLQLKEKVKELENKIHDLERNLVQHGDRVLELEREASELSTKLSLRDEEFNSLQSQKTQLELKIARDREEAAGMKNNNSLAKEREEKVNNGISSKEFEKIKGWFKGSKPSLQVIERKMEELVEEFRKHMEDSIRLMSQRIRVTEQLHVENKENYKITKERLEQENRILEARTFEYSRILSTLDTATTRLKNVAEATNNMLSGLDLACTQFDERSGRMTNRLMKFSEELRYVKNWVVGTKKVNELLKGEMGGLVEQLQRKEENERFLREKISTLLEGKVENVSLLKGLEQVENKMKGLEGKLREKENGILDICEEKREAIRQLCVLIDYQKNRSDHFKQIIIQNHIVTSPRKC